MTASPTIQTNPLDPVFSGIPVTFPQTGTINPTWNKWFTDLREKVNVINQTLAAWSGINPVTGLTPGTYGDATHYPLVTVNQYGMITTISTQAVSGGGGNPMHVTIVTGNYTVVAADLPASAANRGMVVVNSTAPTNVTIDTFAHTAIPIGADLQVFQQNTGATTIVAASGVALVGPGISGGGTGSSGRAIQISQDLWAISGNLAYSSSGDPYWSDVISLLYLTGSNGGTSFPDQISANSWTANGGVTTSTTQSKFGGGSLYNSTGTAYLTLATTSTFNFTGDFTIEGFFYATSAAGGCPMLSFQNGSNQFLSLYCDGVTSARVIIAGANQLTGIVLPGANTWFHAALTRSGSTLTAWVNGTSAGTATYAASITAVAISVCGEGTQSGWTGFVNDIRITNNICRYTANFTPATAPFPNY